MAERAADARLSPGPGEMVLADASPAPPSPTSRAHSVSFQDPCTLIHTPALAPGIPHMGPILTDLALLSNQLPRPRGGCLILPHPGTVFSNKPLQVSQGPSLHRALHDC